MNRSHSAVPRTRPAASDGDRPSATLGSKEPQMQEGEAPVLDGEELDRLRRDLAAWRSGPVAEASRKFPPRLARFSTWSDVEVPDLVTPADVDIDYARDLGLPGQYPFTRGV